MNDSHISFYQTRKFWYGITFIFFFLSFFIFTTISGNGLRGDYGFFFDLTLSLGGLPFLLISSSEISGYVFGVLYYVIQFALLITGFRNVNVSLLPLSGFVALYLLGIFVAFLFGGLL